MSSSSVVRGERPSTTTPMFEAESAIDEPRESSTLGSSARTPVGETTTFRRSSQPREVQDDIENSDKPTSDRADSSEGPKARFFSRTLEIPAYCFLLMLLVVIGLVVAVILVSTIGTDNGGGGSNNAATTPSAPTGSLTLDLIMARGSLNCGVVMQQGFSTFNTTTGQWEGFEVDLVRTNGLRIVKILHCC